MKIIKNIMTILIVMMFSLIVLSSNVNAASVNTKASSNKVTVRK